MKKIISIVLAFLMIFHIPCFASAQSGMVLMEASTQKILVSNNADAKLPMASLTKVMTALVVIENTENLQQQVKIDPRSVGIEGSSMYLKNGQILTVEQLLYGLMLVSGNDAAVALALHTGASLDGFVKMMNETAARLELKDTHFLNPSGLYQEGHYTTAFDFAKLTAYALKNEIFAKIVKTKSYQVGNVTLVNHNRLLRELDGCIGVKTGYTKVCGRCLVSAVERDGVVLICVTLNYADDWNFHKKTYAENFSRCKRVCLLKEKEIYSALKVAGGHNVGYYCTEIYGVIIDDDIDRKIKIHIPKFIYANKKAGESVGTVEILQNEKVIAQGDLLLDRDTRLFYRKTPFFSKLFQYILHMFRF